ncbi:hemerythrin domain-containing protein [Vulgatibacter sp.]|uniref:hemerythrin domain-containing protein n=1 Tax=Vulgatibacter sp. TaxID=1971226 RepID=UPI00356A9639
MKPSEIREQVLEEHHRVLPLLDKVESCARLVMQGAGDVAELRERTRELERVLCELLDDERELLRPALKGADAWGEVRADQLEKSHREQREMLALTREAAEAGNLDPERLAERLLYTVAAIRADLRKEEQRFLSPELLRDDLVSVAQSDG